MGRKALPKWRWHEKRIQQTRANSIADWYDTDEVWLRDAGLDLAKYGGKGWYDWHGDVCFRGALPSTTRLIMVGEGTRLEFQKRYMEGGYKIGRYPKLDERYKRGTDEATVPDVPLPELPVLWTNKLGYPTQKPNAVKICLMEKG